MKKASKILIPALVASIAFAFQGCETPAKYVDGNSPESIVSVNQIDIQDWSTAADAMVASLFQSGVLNEVPQKPASIALSRVVNNTTEHVDLDLLTNQIFTALTKSGQARVKMNQSGAAKQDDLAGQIVQERGNTASERIPDFTLSGKITEQTARAGNIRQVSYVFQLTLTSTQDGEAHWIDMKTITKQGSKNTVGW